MKRLFSIILALVCLFCATALAEESELKVSESHSFRCVANATISVENMLFEEAVTVFDDPNGSADAFARLFFINCTFNAGLTFLGESGSMIIFDDGCEFGNNSAVVMAGAEREATIETLLPRVVTNAPINFVSMARGTVVTEGVEEITVNGEPFRMEDCAFSFDPETGETIDYDPSNSYIYFGVGTWWENGEKVVFSFAE